MRWSNLFIPTLRDTPADAEVASHRLLLRAGFIRQLGAGIYSQLPLAKRCLRKVEQIIREEMERIGAQEFFLPALHPAEVWKESGRWIEMGDNLFRLQDRGGRDMCLGMTHEEVFTSIARDELRSYRQLPQLWYQIQNKFRDEPRPKSGLLRVRQFTMKDSYSFDLDAAGLDHSYELHDLAYRAIFTRCGLEYVAVRAHSGAMGGSESQEFMVKTEAGEDLVVSCSCGYAANLEMATSRLDPSDDPVGESSPERVHTPGQKTINEVSDFLELPQTRQIKSLIYMVDSLPVLILLRGDHQLHETKLSGAVGSDRFRPAESAEIRAAFGASAGSLGPVGVGDMRVLADSALEGRRDLVCGANEDDYHLLHVTPGRDFTPEWHDLRSVADGDACPECGQPVTVDKTVELGHIFKLGYKYSKSMGLNVLDQNGKGVPVVMGSYGIGVERIMVSAVELFHDELGIVWPRSIAPFEVVITVVGHKDPDQMAAGQRLYEELCSRGVDCLLDDRKERPGVKFKDAELIGIPLRLTIGRKLAEGDVELFSRVDRESSIVALDSVVSQIETRLQNYIVASTSLS